MVAEEASPPKIFEGRDLPARRPWLRADLSIVKAWKGDHEGNLVYRMTARNFNPNMATAGKVTIAEVEELVPNGTLDPDDNIHTPGIYLVSRIFQGSNYEKLIEHRTVRPRPIPHKPAKGACVGLDP